MRTIAEESAHVCQSCRSGISCQQAGFSTTAAVMGGYTKHSKTALTPYPSWGIWWPLGSLTLVWRVNWEAMIANLGGQVSGVYSCVPRDRWGEFR